MSYKVLALKYRPTSFDEVVGQTNVTRTLRNAIEQGKIGHAFLESELPRLLKAANQGQFSIEDRDSNTPHIKKIRVVSTVEYYLSD